MATVTSPRVLTPTRSAWLRPHQSGEHLAAVRLPGQGQVGEEGHGLVSAQLHRTAVQLDERRAEQT